MLSWIELIFNHSLDLAYIKGILTRGACPAYCLFLRYLMLK
jgi:hypothetical protein